jgi:hypothetical protein
MIHRYISKSVPFLLSIILALGKLLFIALIASLDLAASQVEKHQTDFRSSVTRNIRNQKSGRL